jgi:hypothetical protein
MRASDFESEGREFESLRERQRLRLISKGFLKFHLRSAARFFDARRRHPIQAKSMAYQTLQITPRNTDAT